MNMVRWDPFRELEEMSSRLNRFFGRQGLTAQPSENGDVFADWAPAVDVQETDTEYLIKADLPAVKREDVKISVEDGILAVEGERKQEKEEKNRKFHRIERSYGTFLRTFTVPEEVEPTKLTAEFKEGMLTVRLPKGVKAKTKAIEVKVAS